MAITREMMYNGAADEMDAYAYKKVKVGPNGKVMDGLKAGGGSIKITHDPVNHPSHYTSGDIECIDAIKEATKGLDGFEGFCTGNAIKYLWRWKKKNGVEDLKKAGWYITRLSNQIAPTEK
jgi:hypothetical protein